MKTVPSPVECVSTILKNNPDLAKDVMDLLLSAEQPGWKESNECDVIKDMCWALMQPCRDARDKYLDSRAA